MKIKLYTSILAVVALLSGCGDDNSAIKGYSGGGRTILQANKDLIITKFSAIAKEPGQKCEISGLSYNPERVFGADLDEGGMTMTVSAIRFVDGKPTRVAVKTAPVKIELKKGMSYFFDAISDCQLKALELETSIGKVVVKEFIGINPRGSSEEHKLAQELDNYRY